MNKFSIENKTLIIPGRTTHLRTVISKQLIQCKANINIFSSKRDLQEELKKFAEDNGLSMYLNLCLIDILNMKKLESS